MTGIQIGRLCAALIFLPVAIFAISQSAWAQGLPQHNRYGVIVWAENYKSTAPVEYADDDARLVGDIFREVFLIPESNIRVVANPTLSELNELFGQRNMPGSIGKNINFTDSELYIYFGGHGSKAEDSVSGAMERYLLAIDTNPFNLADTGLPLNQMIDGLEAMRQSKMPQGRVTVFLESCFSGGFSEGELQEGVSAAAFDKELEPLARARKDLAITVISAASDAQVAYWDRIRQNGVFTATLGDALIGGADGIGRDNPPDQIITYGELRTYLRNNIQSRIAQIKPGEEQTPSISFADDSAIVVDLRNRPQPFIAEIDNDQRIERELNEMVVNVDLEDLSPDQLRTELRRVEIRQKECYADCAELSAFRQKIKQKLGICKSELGLYRRLLPLYGTGRLKQQVENCKCCEHKQAALNCAGSGSPDSDACRTLLSDELLSKLDPTCAPAFAQAKSAAGEQISLAPLETFRRDHPSCPEITAVDKFQDEFCGDQSALLSASEDEAALSKFTAGMKDCPQSPDISARLATVKRNAKCKTAWADLEARPLDENALAVFLERHKNCPQHATALNRLDARASDAWDAAQRAKQQGEYAQSREILERFVKRFDVSMSRENLDRFRAGIDELGQLRKGKSCESDFQRAKQSESAVRMREFIREYPDCPQVVTARDLAGKFEARTDCRPKWDAVRYLDDPKELMTFIDENRKCSDEVDAADQRLRQMANKCKRDAEDRARNNPAAAIKHLTDVCLGQFGYGSEYSVAFIKILTGIKAAIIEPPPVDPVDRETEPFDRCRSQWPGVSGDEQARRQVIGYISDLDSQREDCAIKRWTDMSSKRLKLFRRTGGAQIDNVRVVGGDGTNRVTVYGDTKVRTRNSSKWEYYDIRAVVVRRGDRWLIDDWRLR